MNNVLTIYHANCTGMESNCLYPHEAQITDEASLQRAVSRDYVVAQFKDSYRNTGNYMRSDCLCKDCDNDHSDEPEDWVTPEDVLRTFPDVTIGIHYSRNHMKPKKGKAARPKFHCIMVTDPIASHEEYKQLAKAARRAFPFFDARAEDAAHFFFGTSDARVEFHPGTITLNECLDMYYPDLASGDAPEAAAGTISEGQRNSTMSSFAGRIIKRYGDTERAYAVFCERAEQCDPPLEESELQAIWRSAQGFYKRIAQEDGYVPPDEYNDEGFLYAPDDNSDVGEARILALEFSDRLRFSPATDYICYNGDYWEESIPGAHAVVHQLSDLQLDEANAAVAAAMPALESTGAAEILKKASSKKKAESLLDEVQEAAYKIYAKAVLYRSIAMRYRESKYIKYLLCEAQCMVRIKPQELDADPFLLNTPDVTYDLRKGLEGSMPHDAGDFITKITSVSPSEKGSQLWEAALDTFFCGDQELISYVQLIAGMMALGKVFIEVLIIAYGDGRNGKSTFWNVLARVMGSYSGNVSADTLTVGCRRNIKPELAEAKGKRLLIAAELEEGTRLNTSIVKQLCSTDEVFAEKKYKSPFSYTPSHTLVLYTNHLPRVGATDAGIWRRLIVIPFNAKIEGQSDVKNYADALYQSAGESVLAWIIEGAQRFIAGDFKIRTPDCVQEAINAYRDQNDWLGHFLDDRCELEEGYRQKSGELYIAYRAYCAELGDFTRSTTDFYTSLENTGFARQKTKTGNFMLGLRLKTTEEFPDFLK